MYHISILHKAQTSFLLITEYIDNATKNYEYKRGKKLNTNEQVMFMYAPLKISKKKDQYMHIFRYKNR